MNIIELKKLSYDDLRAVYKTFLLSQDISGATVNTAYVDSFYLWRKGSKEHFWNIVESAIFEDEAKDALIVNSGERRPLARTFQATVSEKSGHPHGAEGHLTELRSKSTACTEF